MNQVTASGKYEWPVCFYGWIERDIGGELLDLKKAGQPKSKILSLCAVKFDKIEILNSVKLEQGVCPLVFRGYQSRRFYGDREYVSRSSFTKTTTRKVLNRAKTAKGRNTQTRNPRPKSAPDKSDNNNPVRERIFRTGWLESEGPAKIEVAFDLPEYIKNLDVKKVSVFFDIKKRDLPVTLSIMNPKISNSRTKWDKLDWKNGEKLEVARLKKYMASDGTLPAFMIDIGSGKAGAGGLSGLSKWKIKNFDIEVIGTTKD